MNTAIVSRGKPLVRRLVIAVLLAATIAPAAVAAAEGPPRRYCARESSTFHGRARLFGLMDNQIVNQPHYLDCTLGILARAGVGFYRTPMLWQYIETSPGRYDWSTPDRVMQALARHRMRWLPIVLGAPPFDRVVAVSRIVGAYSAPAGTADFSRFIAAAVRRYGPGGTFWASHRDLPREPIGAWQIWNEPNLPFYWQPSPSAAAYARLLRAAYRTIRGLDRRAAVITAGLAYSTRGVPALNYYSQLLRRARGAFTAVAVHPYAPTVPLAIRRVELLRTLMDRQRARRQGILVGEYGWASGGPASPYRAASPRLQASMTAGFLRWLLGHRRSLRLVGACYPLWRDPPLPPRGDWWGLHIGLLGAGGHAKPVYGVVLGAARRADG